MSRITSFIPFIFVALWSTGFIGAKFGLPYAEPFTFLMWRMSIVVPLFVVLIFILKRPKISVFDASMQAFIGFLIHGVYLGAVFAAIAVNIPAGVTALFVSLNPLVIALFSFLFFKSSLKVNQWMGLLLGLLGVIVVLFGTSSWEGVLSKEGLVWLAVALITISIGTLLQKQYAQNVDLITGTSYQYLGALIFLTCMSFFFETGEVKWTSTFILTMAWLIIALSIIGVLLLMYMIRHGEASRVASYFYLVPPIAAFWGWLFFDEQWSWLTIIGAAMVIFALFLIKPSSKT